MPTAVGKVGNYVASTPATNEQCAAWAGFVDVSGVAPLNTDLDGDTKAVGAYGAIGPFEQYGEQFGNLVVAEDGIVTVEGGYAGAPWEPQEIPSAALPNGVFAPLWSDLETSVANGRGIRLAQASGLGAAIIQWENLFEFTADDSVGPSVGTFQAWIYNTVEDFQARDDVRVPGPRRPPRPATIGVEDITGEHATAALAAGDPSTVLTPGGSICLDYEGPTFDPATLSYSATVDNGDPRYLHQQRRARHRRPLRPTGDRVGPRDGQPGLHEDDHAHPTRCIDGRLRHDVHQRGARGRQGDGQAGRWFGDHQQQPARDIDYDRCQGGDDLR